MKDIPIKRNRKTAIFSLPWGAWSSPYVTLSSLHLTTTLHIHPPFHPLLSSLLCNMWLMWLFVLYVLTASPGPHFAVASERTAHKLHCLLSLLLAVIYRLSVCWLLSFYISLLLSCCFILGFLLQFHFNCVCAAMMFRSPGTEQFMVNTLQKAQYLANLTFCPC